MTSEERELLIEVSAVAVAISQLLSLPEGGTAAQSAARIRALAKLVRIAADTAPSANPAPSDA